MAKQLANKAAVRKPAVRSAGVKAHEHEGALRNNDLDETGPADNTPKMTQEQAIFNAFATLRNAGLIPVSLEATPEKNLGRALVQSMYRGEQKPGLDTGDHTAEVTPFYTPKQVDPVPGKAMRSAQTQNTQAMTHTLLGEVNSEITNLLHTLQPYLPQWLFSDDEKEGVDNTTGDPSPYLPTGGSDLSPVLVEANRNYNDLIDLKKRLERLNRWIVL